MAGISNEEFASTLRVIPFPFNKEVSSSTIEIWHAAHGKFETQSPIRTLLPFNINNQDQLLAAYTCTPLVTIPFSDLVDGNHVKSTTIAELGSGNMPLDIITYTKGDTPYILIANTSRSLIRIDIRDLQKMEPVTEDIDNGELAGLPYIPLSKIGIVQIDNLNHKNVLTLQRMPNGDLNLITYNTDWL